MFILTKILNLFETVIMECSRGSLLSLLKRPFLNFSDGGIFENIILSKFTEIILTSSMLFVFLFILLNLMVSPVY
jgi:hypothetical protein